MPGGPHVRAWRPDVPGVAEVLHARFSDHAYPLHTHDTWTVLVVDTGAVRYDLDRRTAPPADRRSVTLLPPGVPHDGRAATAEGFRKRVVYLDADRLDVHRVGAAVDAPAVPDPALPAGVDRLHRALERPGDELAAESALTLVTDALARHLGERRADPRPDRGLAGRLRDLIDAHVVEGVRLADAARVLDVTETHLVRSFRAVHGIPPHRYLVGRRLDLARRLLLDGGRPAEVAAATGFYDQAHLTRHFRALLGVTPSAYASGRAV